jgi:PAS domain S-box-containing protein
MAMSETSARSSHSMNEYAVAFNTEDVGRADGETRSSSGAAVRNPHPYRRVPRSVQKEFHRLSREFMKAWDTLRFQSTIFDQIQDTITATDLEGRITYVNQAVVRLFKRPREEIIGQLVDIYGCDPSRGASQREILRETLRTGTWHGEVVNIASDGQQRVIECHTWIMRDEHGRPMGLCGIGTDVTERRKEENERKQFEEHVRDTEKLQSLGVLAGGIAHDFNNLLVGVLGNADLALRDLPERTSARKCVESIRSCALRATELTKQMLAYAGKAKFNVQRIHVSDLVTETGPLLWTSVTRKAQLRYDLARQLPAVRVDVTQMRQVLMNLITNASEAVGNHAGHILVRTAVENLRRDDLQHMHLGEDCPPGRYVILEVSDTGEGMDAQTLANIFTPFFSTKFEGRGLGLSAVLGIVRSHGGAMTVESAPGEGTTFRIYLPAGDEIIETHQITPSPRKELWKGQGLLLVVDDEPAVLRVADSMLQRLGFDTVLAHDGREAVETYRKRKDDVLAVLLDLSMPFMDGFDTLKILRSIQPSVRVILCTGYSRQIAAERFADEQLSAFLQKPFELASIAEAMETALA